MLPFYSSRSIAPFGYYLNINSNLPLYFRLVVESFEAFPFSLAPILLALFPYRQLPLCVPEYVYSWPFQQPSDCQTQAFLMFFYPSNLGQNC